MRRRRSSTRANQQSHAEQQLAGLRAHAAAQKQSTVERLTAAITSLTRQNKPISARSIREECGLEYASLCRNPEALRLYQQHSTYLQQKRRRVKVSHSSSSPPRDPLLAYKKRDLIIRLREEQARWAEQDKRHAELLQEYIQRDIKIAALEAEVARYQDYFARLRVSFQQGALIETKSR